jgi:hypothetical protein
MQTNMVIKEYFIELFRDNGFNCFPIPHYPDSEPEPKRADYRYKGARTEENQIIKENENYGIVPKEGSGTLILDFDNKERYRDYVERMIEAGYYVTESPHGWHLPVVNINGQINKSELFDYGFQDKKIIEIQGFNHYVIGVGSEIFDHKLNQKVSYQKRGGDKFWDGEGVDFHDFVNEICNLCKVESRKKNSPSSYKYLRVRFINGEIPLKGSSNDYFFEAARQCNTNGLSQTEALDKIRIVYDKWTVSEYYSGRPWSNIEVKVQDVYKNNLTIEKGRPQGNSNNVDRTGIVQQIIKERQLFSDVETHEIYENCNGFLEKINHVLKRELVKEYPEMEKSDYESVLFKLESLAEPIPQTNKNLIVFKNGVYDRVTKSIIQTDELADMGFKNFDYLSDEKENEPTQFLHVLFDNIPESEHSRIKAGLRAILVNYLDSRISVLHGEAGTGKSTPLLILVKVLGEYGLAAELDQLLTDRFIRAKIKGLRLLVLQDLPQDWKDFAQIKTMTGEQMKTERGFMQDSTMFENKLKIWASGNYLAKIPEKEKNPMYTRRLSLIHNQRQNSYPEDSSFADKIINEEGEKIISWILNLHEDDCKYEDGKTVREEWENLASPEIEYLQNNWEIKGDITDSFISIVKIIQDFKKKTGKIIDIEQMKKAMKSLGFVVKDNVIRNISEKKPIVGSLS